MQHSFAKNVKESKERNVLLQKNAEPCALLKRTQKNARTLHSFEKNVCPTPLVSKLILYHLEAIICMHELGKNCDVNVHKNDVHIPSIDKQVWKIRTCSVTQPSRTAV